MKRRILSEFISLAAFALPESLAIAGPLQNVEAISASNNHTCAVTTTGHALCWGSNSAFALGDGRSPAVEPNRATPAPVRTLGANVTGVAVGFNHSCAIANGGVKCWGGAPNTGINVIGDGVSNSAADDPHMNPTPAIGLSESMSAISSNYHHTCAIRHAFAVDELWCWGSSYSGQLGNGSNSVSYVPVKVDSLPSPIISVSAGHEFTCAVADAGAWCWGTNASGQLGTGLPNTTPITSPVQVSGLYAGIGDIASGNTHACAVIADGTVQCWGTNGSGELGDGGTTSHDTPAQVVGITSGATMVVAGSRHACALVNGGVKCWGENISGQLGSGSTTGSTIPVDVVGLGSGSGVVAIAAGSEGSYTCAVMENHTAKCWGNNDTGQLGRGAAGGGQATWTPSEVVEPDYIFYDSFEAT